MALSVCGGCRRHVREGEACPFCGVRPRTTLHVWKAAVLTAMVPLGLAACYGVPPTPEPDDAGKSPPSQKDPTTPEKPVEVDSGIPDPSGHDPADPPKPEPEPEPPTPDPVEDSGDTPGGDSSKPDGTDTPIRPDVRPAKKYGAPPRPSTKYGAPPRPKK